MARLGDLEQAESPVGRRVVKGFVPDMREVDEQAENQRCVAQRLNHNNQLTGRHCHVTDELDEFGGALAIVDVWMGNVSLVS